ncbi:MAG: ABC transporter ATP-binding protein [Planctomycetota bacterium]
MIEVDSLSMSFGTRRALEAISFKVPRGSVTGFLGPNGAGKTTTLRVLTSWLLPDPGTGKVIIDGVDLLREPRKACRRIGSLPEMVPLPVDLRVGEFLQTSAQLKGISHSKVKSEIDRVLADVDAGDVIRRRLGTLSQGYRQRIGLADALIGDPPILLLDEPTRGLDPRQVTHFRQLIDRLRGDHTVILSSHVLGEVEQICDRICMISEGRVCLEEDRTAWTERLAKAGSIRVELVENDDSVSPQLAAINGVHEVTADDSGWILQCDRDVRAEIGALALRQGWSLLELRRDSATLESLFLQLTVSGVAT